MNPTPSPAQQWQIELADALFDCWKNKLGGWASHLPTREDMLTLVTKHAAAISEENRQLRGEIDQLVMERDHFHDERDTLREENERLKRERDEAIKAHGFVWNAARKAAQYFRWAGCRDTIAIEAMNQCCEAEKLTPKWSTDWVIVTPLELATLRAQLAQHQEWGGKAREAIVELVGYVDRFGQQGVRDRARALLAAHPAQGMEGWG